MSTLKEQSKAVNDVMNDYRIRVTHSFYQDQRLHKMFGGYTIAYKFTKDGMRAEIAVARCSPKDQYCRKTGKIVAFDRFLEGNTIIVPARCVEDIRDKFLD